MLRVLGLPLATTSGSTDLPLNLSSARVVAVRIAAALVVQLSLLGRAGAAAGVAKEAAVLAVLDKRSGQDRVAGVGLGGRGRVVVDHQEPGHPAEELEGLVQSLDHVLHLLPVQRPDECERENAQTVCIAQTVFLAPSSASQISPRRPKSSSITSPGPVWAMRTVSRTFL